MSKHYLVLYAKSKKGRAAYIRWGYYLGVWVRKEYTRPRYKYPTRLSRLEATPENPKGKVKTVF